MAAWTGWSAAEEQDHGRGGDGGGVEDSAAARSRTQFGGPAVARPQAVGKTPDAGGQVLGQVGQARLAKWRAGTEHGTGVQQPSGRRRGHAQDHASGPAGEGHGVRQHRQHVP